MRLIFTTLILALSFMGCVRKGYVPHYIVTDSLEPAQQSPSIDEKVEQNPKEDL